MTKTKKVDKVIHQYISEQASYAKCSPQWSKAKKQILENEQMKKELMQKLKTLA